MKIRAVLKSLLFSYALTGVSLLLLAFLLFTVIIVVYVFACFMGGFMAGRMVRKDKYLWGVATGIAYYFLLLVVSFAAKGKWDMSVAHAVTIFFMCLGGGTLGGMLS